jgi:prepilin peptidase CpaA
MIELFFALFFTAATSAVLVTAAWHDWRGLMIPNHLSAALVGIFMLGAILPASIWSGIPFVSGLIGGAVVFFLLMLLYAVGAMGGGDTKLAGAFGLLAGTSHLGLFLLVMAFSGGVLAVYALLARKNPEKLIPARFADNSWLSQLKGGQNKIPYGLAIAVGGIVTIAVKWLVPALN